MRQVRDETDSGSNLPHILALIERNDTNYDARYALVLRAVSAAVDAGLKAGFRIDPGEPEWPVAYIELPANQVSWHLPQHPIAWDGHDTPEKYARCRAYREAMGYEDCEAG